MPNPRRPISREQAGQLAHEAAVERAAKSATVVERYRKRANQLRTRNDYPRARDPQLGGGAALAATRPGQLFIDDRGRWQADPSQVIAQTAMQLRDMLPAGIGDPFLFVAHPNDRVPLTAIHYFQDKIAAQADVINGTGGIAVDAHMRVLLTIRPSDASEAIAVQVEGTPLIASGFPHERVPDQRMGTFEAATQLMRALEGSRAPHAVEARAALATVDLADHAAVGRVLDAYPEARQELVRAQDDKIQEALGVLAVNRAWVALRTEGADRTDRIMLGDQANLHTLNPMAALRWVITGVGGTSISAAEIILNGNRAAKVTMIGRSLPPGLNTNDQFRDVYTTFGPLGQNRFDILTDQVLGPATTRDGGASVSTGGPVSGGAKIDGDTTIENLTDPMLSDTWVALAVGPDQLLAVRRVLEVNPAAKVKLVAAELPPNVLASPVFRHLVTTYGPPSDRPRLDIASGAYFAALRDNGARGFETAGPVTGDGFVNGTGRGGQAAPIIEDLVRHAMLNNLPVVGELLWSDDRRYLGYRVRIGAGGSARSFDVTGAASRFLPAEPVFDGPQRKAVAAQTDLDAPEESGNFDGGFVSSAIQAARYGRQAGADHQLARSFRLVAHSGRSLDLPSGQSVAVWADRVRIFLAAELDVEPDRLTVLALAGGASPDVPFKVTLGTAELGVFKVFRDPALAQNEIDMLRIMASKHPTQYQPVAAKSDGVVDVTGGTTARGAMLMETAQGDSVAQMVKLLPPHGHPQRNAGLLRIVDAAARVARSLADLHQGTASGENLTREQKIGEGSDAHYLRYTKLPKVKDQLGKDYDPICFGINLVMDEYGQDHVVVPASAYHGDANLGNFIIDDRARVQVFDVDGMRWSVDKATEKGTKTGASDLGRFIGSLGTMNLNMPNSLQDVERGWIRAVFLKTYFAASPNVRPQHLEPAIKLSRIELELAALTNNAIPPEAAIARIYEIIGRSFGVAAL